MIVSVVIAACNAQDWLAETLTRVLAQTHRELEIIVVDDGSTDRTAEIATEILSLSPLPYRVIAQNNCGPSAARNRGWRAAKGEWIQFLDADDLLHPQKIELQIRRVGDKPDIAVIYSDWQHLILNDVGWSLNGPVQCPSLGRRTASALLKDSNVLALGSQIIRRETLEQVNGFDETHELIEDVELYLKIAISGGSFLKAESSTPLFYYRDRPGSLSKSCRRRFADACVRNAQFVEYEIGRTSGLQPEDIEPLVEAYHIAARYFGEHDWERFESLVAHIETLQPGFRPRGPRRLRLASLLVGYRNAEKLALRYRRTMKWAATWGRGKRSVREHKPSTATG
jgi:hypothetical protein